MLIQEMRSGLAHLAKRTDDIDIDEIFRMVSASEAFERVQPVSELEESRWSVISASQIEAGGLTYRQASSLIDELILHGIDGLCLVTDESAARLGL